MTLEWWKWYFRILAPAPFIPMAEYAFFGTAWSFIPVACALGWAVLTLRCMNCDLPVYDHRIAGYFDGIGSMKKCPNCGKKMVPRR